MFYNIIEIYIERQPRRRVEAEFAGAVGRGPLTTTAAPRTVQNQYAATATAPRGVHCSREGCVQIGSDAERTDHRRRRRRRRPVPETTVKLRRTNPATSARREFSDVRPTPQPSHKCIRCKGHSPNVVPRLCRPEGRRLARTPPLRVLSPRIATNCRCQSEYEPPVYDY